MNSKIGTDFLLACKQNYFDKITPVNSLTHSEGYSKVVNIAKEYFANGMQNEFAGFFQEGQYFVAIWAAHMLLEYGNVDKELAIDAINVIKKYSDNPLAPEIAKEEKRWLDQNMGKYI